MSTSGREGLCLLGECEPNGGLAGSPSNAAPAPTATMIYINESILSFCSHGVAVAMKEIGKNPGNGYCVENAYMQPDVKNSHATLLGAQGVSRSYHPRGATGEYFLSLKPSRTGDFAEQLEAVQEGYREMLEGLQLESGTAIFREFL